MKTNLIVLLCFLFTLSLNAQSSQDDMLKYMEMMGGGAASIDDYPDRDDAKPSSFEGSFEMVITTSKNGKIKDQGIVGWHIGKYEVAIIPKVDGMDGGDSKILLNRKKGVMAILTDIGGNKTGFLMDMKTVVSDITIAAAEGDMDDVKVEVFKSQKEMIQGYKCYKVVASNDEFESESWVTEDVDLDMSKLMGYMNMQNNGGNDYLKKFGNINGWPIKTTTTDKESGEVSTMEMKNIKKGNAYGDVFSTDGYTLMEMPNFGNEHEGME